MIEIQDFRSFIFDYQPFSSMCIVIVFKISRIFLWMISYPRKQRKLRPSKLCMYMIEVVFNKEHITSHPVAICGQSNTFDR